MLIWLAIDSALLFNSIDYILFLPIIVAAYFAIPHRYRWVLLLAASYYFYMCWKAEYVFLILASTAIDYAAGIRIAASTMGTPVRPRHQASNTLRSWCQRMRSVSGRNARFMLTRG